MSLELKSQTDLEKIASTHSFKLLAELEDKRLKFNKNYIYNGFLDPNPDKGSFSEWRSSSVLTESNQVQDKNFYKIFIYHPFKQTKMLGISVRFQN